MAQKWYIKKSAKKIGPWSSDKVREALREGTLSLEDYVVRQGTTIERAVIEVSELFGGDLGDHIKIPASEDPVFALLGGYNTALVEEVAKVLLTRGKGDRDRRSVRYRKSNVKSYILIEKGLVAGKYDAQELIKLHAGGVLARGVKVRAEGSSTELSIDEFLDRFNRSASKVASSEGKGGNRARMFKGASMSLLAIVLLVFAGFLIKEQLWQPSSSKVYKISGKKVSSSKKTKKRVSKKLLRRFSKASVGSKKAIKKDHPGAIASIRQLKKIRGKEVIVGPLSFDSRSLSRCQRKCSLTVNDSQGRSMKVFFFKAGGYHKKLKGLESRVFLKGRAQSAGFFLSRVLP